MRIVNDFVEMEGNVNVFFILVAHSKWQNKSACLQAHSGPVGAFEGFGELLEIVHWCCKPILSSRPAPMQPGQRGSRVEVAESPTAYEQQQLVDVRVQQAGKGHRDSLVVDRLGVEDV